jgi:pyochelin synthetase
MIARDSSGVTPILAPDLLDGGFRASCESRPDSLALVTDEASFTYAQLNVHVRRVRALLADARVERGDLVAVVMRKSWEGIVAFLAILGRGAAYVPIDAELPPERIRMLLDDAAPACVLVQEDGRTLAFGHPAVCVRDTPSAPDAPEVRARAGDLCYVIYTSGSTGRPKGVMIEHGAVANTIADVNRRFRVGPDDAIVAVSPYSFDLSVYDVFGAFAAGARIVLPDVRLARTPRYLALTLAKHGVTVWNSAPSVFELLVRDAEARGERLPERLRLVMLSGDWIDVDLPGRLRALSGAELISLGGATEASIWSIAYPVERVDPAWKSIPYGYPLANQSWYVLDEATMRECAPGERGMLYIGGVGLARGYFGDPAKTAAAFVTHPETGERIYRTGDYGRMRDDGALEILGREDAQVKIRGYRVELGEIEAALLACPGVRSARVVLDRRDGAASGRGPQDLVAGFVAAGRPAPSAAELREHLQRSLPAYMIPRTIGALDALPLTPNGKVDTAAMLEVLRPGSAPGRDPV